MILKDFHTLQSAHMQHTELYKYARMYVHQVHILTTTQHVMTLVLSFPFLWRLSSCNGCVIHKLLVAMTYSI